MPDSPAVVAVDQGSLTIDELDLIYEVTGAELEDIEAGTVKVPGRVLLRAFALLALRRANPDATLAEAGKVDVDGVNRMLGERPTRAAGPPATRPSAASRKLQASRSNGSRG